MKLLIKGRRTGKTTQMLYTSEATGYPIVVHSRQMVSVLKNRAKQLGISIPEPITVNDLRMGFFSPKGVLIDEADKIISDALDAYLGCHVVAATLTDGY